MLGIVFQSKSASCLVAGRECIFVGCADGVVRVFSPSTLLFLTTLPRPHHLGVDVSKAINSRLLVLFAYNKLLVYSMCLMLLIVGC